MDGKIIAEGSGPEIAANDLVRMHYLGQQFGTDTFAKGDQVMDAGIPGSGAGPEDEELPPAPPEEEEGESK